MKPSLTTQTKLHHLLYLLIAGFILFSGLVNFQSLSTFGLVALSIMAVVAATELVWNVKFQKRGMAPAVLAPLFLLGYFGVVAGISNLVLKIFFSVAAAVLFFAFSVKDNKKRLNALEDIFTLVAAFFVLVFVWSIDLYFRPPWWANLLEFFGFFLLFFWQMFYKLGARGIENVVYALSSTLIIVEIGWTALFLPVHFLTAAAISFAFFYIIYTFSNLYFMGKLSTNKIYFHLVLILIVVLSSLASSAWQP